MTWAWMRSASAALIKPGVESPDFIDQIEPDPLRHLYLYWQGLKGQGDIPNRQLLDPGAIKFCLANVALAEVEHAPFRVRYRLVGTKLVEAYGRDLTNCYVDELYSPSVSKDAMEAYWQVVSGRQPHYAKRSFNLLLRRFGYYRLMLPFSWRSKRVDIILLGLYQIGEDPMAPAALWRDLANWTG